MIHRIKQQQFQTCMFSAFHSWEISLLSVYLSHSLIQSVKEKIKIKHNMSLVNGDNMNKHNFISWNDKINLVGTFSLWHFIKLLWNSFICENIIWFWCWFFIVCFIYTLMISWVFSKSKGISEFNFNWISLPFELLQKFHFDTVDSK